MFKLCCEKSIVSFYLTEQKCWPGMDWHRRNGWEKNSPADGWNHRQIHRHTW